jgi:hypothetical protein
VGDDILFDRLSDLATRDASANVWDDTDVQARLAELGIQLPADAPADPGTNAEPDPAQTEPVQESRTKELAMDLEDPLMSDEEFETKYGDSREAMQGRAGRVQDRRSGEWYDPAEKFDQLKNSPEFGAQMRRMSQSESALSDLPRPNKRNQFRSLHKLRKQRGLGEQGVPEGGYPEVDHMPGPTIKRTQTGCKRCHGKGYVYKTPDGETHPMNRPDAKKYKCGKCAGIGFVKVAEQGVAEGPVTKQPQPYNDPNWTKNLPKEKLDTLAGRKPPEKKLQGVDEASGCNHTREGEMCPEHGLTECGMHESQVAESQDTDALLARIKSLALLR